ncbi:MAG TPA: D-alanine--D-alanine ligase [Patescibacteria group bacterium]|nr:D-alanine--D-alanine ligase [Patescibacteria group bacterium]
MKIIVLGGGISPEREVSLRSSAAVKDALIQAGYKVIYLDPKDGLDALDDLSAGSIVFPILHGEGGEDGIIQSELEKRNLPYLGTMSAESVICFDKWQTHEKLEQAGIPMAQGVIVDKNTYATHKLAKKPHVLKVLRGGSSIGTYIARDLSHVGQDDIDKVFSLSNEALIEELIEGSEITVPIFDDHALPVIEIVPPTDQEFDYKNKYNGLTQEICPPQSVDGKTQERAQKLAEHVHQTLGARHFSRIDIIVQNDGDLKVLELNTIPGMGAQSLYPKSAAEAGMSMPDLVKKFVKLVERDYGLAK